jgi:hypothetical protein
MWKGIEVCCDQKCMHKYVFQKNSTWKYEWVDEWKGKESISIPSLYCD